MLLKGKEIETYENRHPEWTKRYIYTLIEDRIDVGMHL